MSLKILLIEMSAQDVNAPKSTEKNQTILHLLTPDFTCVENTRSLLHLLV